MPLVGFWLVGDGGRVNIPASTHMTFSLLPKENVQLQGLKRPEQSQLLLGPVSLLGESWLSRPVTIIDVGNAV